MEEFHLKIENEESEAHQPTNTCASTQIIYVPCYIYQNSNMLAYAWHYQQMPKQIQQSYCQMQQQNSNFVQQSQIMQYYSIKQEEEINAIQNNHLQNLNQNKIKIKIEVKQEDDKQENKKDKSPRKIIKKESYSIPASIKKKYKSLAERNIKHNFASGVSNFIKFKINKLKLASVQDDEKLNKQKELLKIHGWIQNNKKNFRCFDGWREMSQDLENGNKFIKICQQFFSRSFARIYIQQSRIMDKYKEEHIKKIYKFKMAVRNIKLFNPYFFKE